MTTNKRAGRAGGAAPARRAPNNNTAIVTAAGTGVEAREANDRPGVPSHPEPAPVGGVGDTRRSDIAEFLKILVVPKGVFEVRIPRCPDRLGLRFTSTWSGYYLRSRRSDASREVCGIEEQAPPGVYCTLNSVDPNLLARAENKINPKAQHTTGDAEIVGRRWLMIDLDPVRPAGISSTDTEMNAALDLAHLIADELGAVGWPRPLICMSGNGAYCLYRIDLPNDAESTALVRGVTDAIGRLFDTDAVTVDRATFNAARIVKLIGTMARKGDHLEVRPHRRSWYEPPAAPLMPVDPDLLQRLVDSVIEHSDSGAEQATSSAIGADGARRTTGGDSRFAKFDHSVEGVAGYLRERGVEVTRVDAARGRIILGRCPITQAEGGTSVAVLVSPPGRIAFSNLHDRGTNLRWMDLREHLEPGYRAWVESLRSGNREPAIPQQPREARADADEWESFPVDALGEPLAGFCTAVGESIGCDPAFAAVPLLAALAGAIGNRACVELKPGRAGWTEPAILWTMTVGRSGCGKSPALKDIMRPMNRRQSVAFAKWRQSRDAADLLGDKADPVPPPERSVVKQITVEALADRLEKNPRGLLLSLDELAGWMRGFGQYKGGRGDDAAQWLSLYDADPMTVDRKAPDAPTLYIPRPAVSVVGGIQPGKLRRVMTPELMDSGFGPRILMAWPPSAPVGWTDATVDDELAGRVEAVFDALLALPMDTDDNGEPAPRRFTLSAQALDLFIDHANGIGAEQVDADTTDADAAALSKLKGAAARIALVLHLARHHQRGAALPDLIKSRTMRSAVRIAHWFADEGRRIRRKLGLDADAPTAGKRRAGSGPSLASAVAFLRERLAGGPVAMVEVEADAKVRGIAPRTLRRAKLELEVRSVRAGSAGGNWAWSLSERGQNAEGGQIVPELAAFDEPIAGQGDSPKVAKMAKVAKVAKADDGQVRPEARTAKSGRRKVGVVA